MSFLNHVVCLVRRRPVVNQGCNLSSIWENVLNEDCDHKNVRCFQFKCIAAEEEQKRLPSVLVDIKSIPTIVLQLLVEAYNKHTCTYMLRYILPLQTATI